MRAVAKPKQKLEYEIDQEVPCYKYVGKRGFFTPEDELLEFGSVFYLPYEEEPTEDFEPMNDLARERMNQFFDKLDACGKAKAEKDGKMFAPRPRSFNGSYELPTEDGRKIQVIRDGAGVPLMGAKRRGRPPKVRKAQDEPIPDTSLKRSVNVGVEAT